MTEQEFLCPSCGCWAWVFDDGEWHCKRCEAHGFFCGAENKEGKMKSNPQFVSIRDARSHARDEAERFGVLMAVQRLDNGCYDVIRVEEVAYPKCLVLHEAKEQAGRAAWVDEVDP